MQITWTPTQIDVLFKVLNFAVVPIGLWAIKYLIKTSRELLNGIIEQNAQVIKTELITFIDEKFKAHDECDRAIVVRLVNVEALLANMVVHKVELIK